MNMVGHVIKSCEAQRTLRRVVYHQRSVMFIYIQIFHISLEFRSFAICGGFSNLARNDWPAVGFAQWMATITTHGYLGNVSKSESTVKGRGIFSSQ